MVPPVQSQHEFTNALISLLDIKRKKEKKKKIIQFDEMKVRGFSKCLQ